MTDSAPKSCENKTCGRCEVEFDKDDWRHGIVDEHDRTITYVCNTCAHELGPGLHDTSDWPLDDETPQEDAEFRPATEVYSGP